MALRHSTVERFKRRLPNSRESGREAIRSASREEISEEVTLITWILSLSDIVTNLGSLANLGLLMFYMYDRWKDKKEK